MGLGVYAGSSQRPTEVVISELQCKGMTAEWRNQFYGMALIIR